MVNIFRRDLATYPMSRPKIMAAYLNNMSVHIKRAVPDATPDEIETFIKEKIQERLKRPKVNLLSHPRYGLTKPTTADLLSFTDGLTNQIITPSGAIYMPPSQKVSILSETLKESTANRNVFKHKQLEAAATGDTVQEQTMKLLQASSKIFNNSIPGAMGTPYSFLFDLPGYNAITSGGRQCVKTGYSHVERMIGSNVYVTSLDDVINYVVNHLQACPYEQVAVVMAKYGLTYPTVEALATFFLDCLSFYTDVGSEDDIDWEAEPAEVEGQLRKKAEREPSVHPLKARLWDYLSSLSDVERAFIMYGYGYKNLLMHNEVVMRKYLAEFFRRDIPIDPASNPADIFKVEGDLLIMAMSLNFDVIDKEPKLEDAITKNPDGVRKLLSICRHMEARLNDWIDLWQTFMCIDVSLARIWEHPDIVRRCVLVSDTDSVIFSTVHITKWYSPEKSFSQDAYDINAFSVFLVSQSLEHLFGRMTAGMGIEPNERGLIKMKNEFYYPIFIRSPMAKHYLGAIRIQEGKILPKPKMDLKGLNFRGSDLPEDTTAAFETFYTWVIKELTENDSISGNAVMAKIVEHEFTIYNSLMAGEKTFLSTTPVKNATEYANPLSSSFFYYMLWQEVFQQNYGEFVIPNKGYVAPLKDGGKCLQDPEWLALVEKEDPAMLERLKAFQVKYAGQSPSRLILPPSLPEVPAIFRTIMDVRKILHGNGRPFFLLARSLGCGFDDKQGLYIASDFLIMNDRALDVAI